MEYTMENVSQIVQKVRQAHWRVQRQWVGLFLLGLVAVSMVAGIYLNITVRASLVGHEAEQLQSKILDERLQNSGLATQLAGLTSVASFEQRAQAMGFQPASPQDITYVTVSGYTPRSPWICPNRPPVRTCRKKTILLPAYTESLFDWITRKLTSSSITEANHENNALFWRYLSIAIVLAISGLAIPMQIVRIQSSPEVAGVIGNGSYIYKIFYPARGEIYDRNGNLLAGNTTVYEVDVDLTAKPDKQTIALAAQMALGMDPLRPCQG